MLIILIIVAALCIASMVCYISILNEQQSILRVAQSHDYRPWGVSRHGPLDAAYASRAGLPL